MRLSAGVKLRLYETLALIGTGGMGEVYRRHDTRHAYARSAELSRQLYWAQLEIQS